MATGRSEGPYSIQHAAGGGGSLERHVKGGRNEIQVFHYYIKGQNNPDRKEQKVVNSADQSTWSLENWSSQSKLSLS